tara:strand:- start:86 stop:451 length:366 start_codon:yes stop_codon:yes gene_type:complete
MINASDHLNGDHYGLMIIRQTQTKEIKMSHDKLSTYKTSWYENNGNGSVIYQHTKIVDWTEDKIILNSDGWETVTTKRKMNQTANQFCLHFAVYQENYEWFVVTPKGETVPFEDNMTIRRH